MSTEHAEVQEKFQIRTDLALEAREALTEDGRQTSGIVLEEWEEAGGEVRLSRVTVENSRGARTIGKPKGVYLTMEADALWKNDGGIHREIAEVLAEQILWFFSRMEISPDASVLTAGLGNPEMTSDSLGPQAAGNLCITRNLRKAGRVSAIVPGVMAQTGMEAAEIIRGVVKETRPDVLLVIDALAARSVRRLGTTIQLTDTGIQPGSGVGNHRNHIDRISMGIPVLAIGVPTVVGAAAIVYDAVGQFMEEIEEQERYRIVKELVEPNLGPMYVTPKDVDEKIRRLSFTLSEGINIALVPDAYIEG